MDYSTAMAMESMQTAQEFMRNIYPWICLLVLLVTILVVMVKEKRRRALLLEQSEEEARIRSLPDLGEADKERLLASAAPLPISKEAFPLPDVPLRLVSALAKVFGFLKIVMLVGAAYIMARIFDMADGPGTWSSSSTHPILLSLFIVGLVILSVLQIIASTRVTRGSNRARRFLIFMAVVELGPMIQDPTMAHAALWHGIMVAMSACMLWVLLLRPRAQAAIMHNAGTTRLWQKAAILVLAVACLVSPPFDLKLNMNNTYQSIDSSMGSSSNNGIKLPITRIHLLAGDESKETMELMEQLQAKSSIPVELIAFGQVLPQALNGHDLVLLVSKTLDQKMPKKPEPQPQLPKSVMKILAKEDPGFAGFFQPQPSGDAEIAFNIETPFSHINFASRPSRQRRLLYEMDSPEISISVRAEYSRGNRDKAIDELGDSVEQQLANCLRSRNETSVVSALPEPLAIEPDTMDQPKLSFVSNAVQVAHFFTPEQQINLYRLPDNSPEFLTAISNELVSANWEHESHGRYQKGNERIVIAGPAYYAAENPLPHIHMVHSKCRDAAFPESFPVELCQQNFAYFIEIFRANSVPEDILREATQKYLETPDLSAQELYKVYISISNIEGLDSIKPDLLYRFAQVLHGEPISEQTFALYRNLAEEMAKKRLDDAEECYGKIKALYADQIFHLELKPGTNGMDQAEITLEDLDRPKMITFSKTRNDPANSVQHFTLYFLGWLESMEDGQYKSHYADPRRSGTEKGKVFNKRYIRIPSFQPSGEIGSYSCGDGSYTRVEEMTRPGSLSLVHEFSATNNTLKVEVFYNDITLDIARTPDGNYILNKEILTADELHERLRAKHEKAEKFKLYASLKESEQEEFYKTVISDLPQQTRIEYNDLPERDANHPTEM
ncbi:MAG: hypothetical protein GXY61_09995 [Lentisphaerae bacterium]|nr:hypothetical protein [Lentisphaerota bacterium]